MFGSQNFNTEAGSTVSPKLHEETENRFCFAPVYRCMGNERTTGTEKVNRRAEAPDVAVSVEGRSVRRVAAALWVVLLAVGAFFGGQRIAESREFGGRSELAMAAVEENRPKPDDGEQADDSTITSPAFLDTTGSSAADDSTALSIDPSADTLRFIPFDGPLLLIDAETTAELNYTVGVDTSTLVNEIPNGSGTHDRTESDQTTNPENTAAIVSDLVVFGPAGSTVSVHPGDRPGDGFTFTVPKNGRLLVPHLVATTDDSGRVVVAAETEVKVEMRGIGRYVSAERTRAGRFVGTGSVRVGSLVTATDGRRLVVSLPAALGADANHVGNAVIRLNANVGRDGGSVSIGEDLTFPWPAPSVRDTGLAATELLTVEPNDDGEIIIDYLGGSVLTVDLVGYYTNTRAQNSSSGLLVLFERPDLQTLGAEDGDLEISIEPKSLVGNDRLMVSGAMLTAEVVNGTTAGAVGFRNEGALTDQVSTFALAPGQRRNTTEWVDGSQGWDLLVQAPDQAVVRMWTVGVFT